MDIKKDIQVMIVDDSLSMRLFLSKVLNGAEGIKVVATACDPLDAMNKLKTHQVDVMTLDVEMPKMDGITFLKKIMRLKPLPIVMISTLTKKGSQTAIEALNFGAIDVVGKPSHKIEHMQENCHEIISKVIEASHARVDKNSNGKALKENITTVSMHAEKSFKIDEVMPLIQHQKPYLEKKLVAIASSTGGPLILREILSQLNNTLTPPILIVQHIGLGFSEALAKSLNLTSKLTVCHALDGQILKNGHVYLSPSGIHMGVVADKGFYKIKLYNLSRVNRHKPSADILFRTICTSTGKDALAFILTGMGDDGAIGLKELFNSGAKTFVQTEESCTVYGMPRAALCLEPKHTPLSIPQIINKIKEYTK